MKKLLVLLLISAIAIFVFAGCDGFTPGEGEDEGEDEGEVSVNISNSVKINGIDYVKSGTKTITVTFPAPVEGMVQANITDCTVTSSATKILSPNEDKTVWTGTINFDCLTGVVDPCDPECDPCAEVPCCEAVITIISGACDVDECIVLPVIVDCEGPEIDLQVRFWDCGDPCDPCDETTGVYFEFTSDFGGDICNPDDCCDDQCSCVADWSFVVNVQCNPSCILATGTDCPVEGETNCQCLPYPEEGRETYEVTFKIKDCVGNISSEVLEVELDTDELVSVNGEAAVFGDWIDFPVTNVCIEEPDAE
jgi:hypothetical protein